MKSYLLTAVQDSEAARAELTKLLPGQTEPWLLINPKGSDPVAYFNVDVPRSFDELEGPFIVQADISGRHYNEDQMVIGVLRALRGRIGGVVRDDDDNVV